MWHPEKVRINDVTIMRTMTRSPPILGAAKRNVMGMIDSRKRVKENIDESSMYLLASQNSTAALWLADGEGTGPRTTSPSTWTNRSIHCS